MEGADIEDKAGFAAGTGGTVSGLIRKIARVFPCGGRERERRS